MAEDSKDRVLRVLEQAGIPLAAVLYWLATVVQLRDALDKLGWRIASVLILLVCVAWTAYVWTAKRPNLLDPAHLQNRYGLKTRFISLLAIIAAGLPAWYVVVHPTPPVPPLLVKVVNRTSTPAELLSYGEVYFTSVGNALVDTQIGSTRVEVTRADRGNSLTVPARSFIWVSAHFLNEPYTEGLLGQEDIGLGLVLRTRDRRMLQTEGIPFRKRLITTKYIELDLNERE